jgi:SAM-dependent methyltransferase
MPDATTSNATTPRPALDPAAARAAALDIAPPLDLMLAIGATDRGGFERVGDEFLGYLCRFAELKPDEHILDIGSGSGRMAIPLTGYLADGGQYDGCDVWQPGIDWCRQHITSQRPEFHFERFDIWNAKYNPIGQNLGSDYQWPYPDNTFDVVVAMSVYTHLMPRDAARYVAEVARVLKPGGRSLMTWFLLDDASRAGMAAGHSSLPFEPHPVYGSRCYVVSPEAAEEAVAYDLDRALGYYRQSGLDVPTIHFGGWSGRPDNLSAQDIIVGVKPVPPASDEDTTPAT